MGSPVTFSGFNNIDFNVILNSVMRQESQPLTRLQDRQSQLQSRKTQFANLATRVAAIEKAATALAASDAASAFTATTSDATTVGVSASTTAAAGRYEIKVNELARAQVTASASQADDADVTAVATGGSLQIGGATVTLTGATTLKQLATAINDATGSPARASVIQSSPGAYKLVLTAKNTGEANGFLITSTLTGGSGVAFTDTDNDGTAGDSAADNAIAATNASVLVNNIEVSSASNTLDAVIPGVSLTLKKKDPSTAVIVDVTADTSALKTKVSAFVTAYNDFVKFSADAGIAAGIGRDPVLRQLRQQLRGALAAEYDNGGAQTYLSQAGIGFIEGGGLKLDEEVLDGLIKSGTADLTKLFSGASPLKGAFAELKSVMKPYTQTSGIFWTAQHQITSQITRLGDQIGDMQERLAVRRSALQAEFTAADAAMSRLRSQSGSLSSIGQL